MVARKQFIGARQRDGCVCFQAHAVVCVWCFFFILSDVVVVFRFNGLNQPGTVLDVTDDCYTVEGHILEVCLFVIDQHTN